jgi:ABC-type protease/lipase transport system fused ATPase/permease subunit
MEAQNATSTAINFPSQPAPPPTIQDILNASKFREDVEPPEEDAILKQRGFALGSAGNIGNVGGQSKSGKSTGALQSILGAAMGGAGEDVLHFCGQGLQLFFQGLLKHFLTQHLVGKHTFCLARR